MTTKNNMISFWRVIFTYAVILYHFFNVYGRINGWAIGVEFFFIVSGWLLADDLKKHNRTPYAYTWHRIKRLYPQYLLAFIVSAGFYIYNMNFTAGQALNWFGVSGVRELLCIHYWPWTDTAISNIVTWYVCILIFAGLILYSLCKRFPNVTKEIIIPVSIVIGLTYSYRMNRSLLIDFYDGIFYHHWFMRGFLELGIGILLYEFNEKYGLYFKKKIVQIVGFLLLVFTVAVSLYLPGELDYLYLLLIAIGVIVSFNTKLPYDSKVIGFFDRISYSIYLNHNVVRMYVMPKYFDSLSIQSMIIYLLIVTIFSIIMYFVFKALCSLFGKVKNKMFL